MALELTVDPSQWLEENAGLPVIGGPIATPQWFDRDIHTLADFVDKRYPPWGVIVRPPSSLYRDTLVWHDAFGRFRIVDVNGTPLAEDVVKAPYEEPSGNALNDLLARIESAADAAASAVPGALTLAAVAAVVIILFTVLPKRA